MGQVTILSWNIWIDCPVFGQVRDFLREKAADIICLQEVKDDDPRREIIGYLAGLGYEYVLAPTTKVWAGPAELSLSLKSYGASTAHRDGPAVFSKYPIRAHQIYNLSPDADNRTAVRADIEIGKTLLHVFNTHLIHTHQQPSAVQELQAASLLKVLPADHTVVMGDFNATPESEVIQMLKKALVDTDPASAPTWSVYPEGCSVCNPQKIDTRLDYIFTSKDIKSHSFQALNSRGSDHLPIGVTIEVYRSF